MNPFRKNRGPKSQNNQRPESRTYRPCVEAFEDRIVPAGHVTAVIQGGNLILTGDSGDNQIKITGSTRGPIDIEAIDTTTIINDQPGMVTLLGFRGSIFADMGDGNDVLTIGSIGPRGMLRVDMGAGDDILTLTTASISSLMDLNLGSGDDVLNLQSVNLQAPLRANGGAGDDQINMNSANLNRQSFFIGGGGIDSIGYVNSKIPILPSVQDFRQTIGAVLPRAFSDTATVARGASTVINVLANDTPNSSLAGFDKTSVTVLDGPAHGFASVLPDGTITYTHDNSFSNKDSFRYTVRNDNGALSNTATVNITVTGFTGPTVSLSTTATSPTKANPIPYTATFSDDVTGFTLSDITVTGGTATNLVAVNAKTYTFGVTPTVQGTVTVTVPAGVAQNVLGLNNSASSPSTVTVDSVAPVITINPLITNDTTPSITGTVNDASAVVKVTVNGQTITATISGTTWTANVTSTLAEGTYPVSATATDTAGNVATANNATGLIVDVTPPTVAITSTSSSTTNLAKIPVKITFSEAVGSFTDVTDIVVTGGTASDFFGELGGKIYDINVTPTGPGPITVSVNAGVANDQAGNVNTASNTLTRTSTVSTPTAAITTTATSPTSSQTIPITVTFSEDIVDFFDTSGVDPVAKIVVGNGTAGTFTQVDAKTYTGSVTATAPGTVTVNLPANTVHNTGGSGNAAAPQLSVVYNNSAAPVVAISSSATSPTGTPAIPITITFSKDVTGFVAGDVVVANGTLTNFSSVDAKTYTATVTATASGPVTVDVAANVAQDSSNTGNLAAPQFAITYSPVAPTVGITSSATNPTGSAAIPITFTFTKDVTGFVAGDVVVGNGTLTNFTAVDAKTYTATVTATASGAVTINVPANVAQDSSTNTGNAAATPFSITFTPAAPTVAITTTVNSPSSTAVLPITITFSENVTGFTASDVAVGNGTLTNFAAVDGKTYTATVIAGNDGVVTVNVPANAAQSSFAVGNAVAPPLSINVVTNNSAPTLAHAIANLNKTSTDANTVFTVSGTFDDANIGTSTATLNIIKGNTAEAINLQFFDRDAPASVNNFLNYANTYAANGGAVFHRLVTQTGLKIIQGGGYYFSDIQNDGGTHVPTIAPIRLEYSPLHENVNGTIAMARTGVQDSGTSEFFFNLDDGNSSTLNGSNGGGYAVFGKGATPADVALMDDLLTVPVISLSNSQNSPFTTFPYLGAGSPPLTVPDTVRISSLAITHRDAELTYTVSSSNPAAATATVGGFQGNQITLDYLAAGTTTITVTATDSVGHVATTTFTVTVT